ncbi:MAG: 5-formyltetrahydrofolate cyclo-ligase [Coriobacteriia bacterium]|nr:5-formyltetrahydrofolate cyclo-ligase [Coriobacteriia bacterium]MCL2536808.1 5-formyltetrahydrofolate cyclo-ligase [Coriobacteriia bacterium]
MTCADEKKHVRDKATAIRNEIAADPGKISRATKGIATQLLSVPAVRELLAWPRQGGVASPLFASYAPRSGEANPNGFLDIIEKDGGARPNMAFPRVTGKAQLSMHYATVEELAPGSFGIAEPGADMPVARLADIDVILVPGLAFDAQGNRLGYGRGYFDRLLGSCDVCDLPLLIGITYDETLLESVPCETHDIKVDYIVTPTMYLEAH